LSDCAGETIDRTMGETSTFAPAGTKEILRFQGAWPGEARPPCHKN